MTLTQHAPPPDQSSGRRGVLAFVGATTAGVAATALVATVDPNRPGHYPTCPFLFVTGLWCPGCGTLRAVHDLAHGDLVGALDRNPLASVLLPYVLFTWVCWGLRLTGRDTPHPTRIRPVWIWTLLGVVLVYWVARNVPGWTWLSPA